MTLNIKIKKLNPNAKIPTKAYEVDAGLDLYASEETFVPFGSTVKVLTGIALGMPKEPHIFGKIEDRSSMSSKGLMVSGGVIDSSFTGEISIVVNNFCYIKDFLGVQRGYKINKGDKIAQIIFHELPKFNLTEVSELDSTDRGSGGFGSSGK